MAGTAINYGLDKFGVNVDKSEIDLGESELREAQNAMPSPLSVDGGITKRLGLLPITPDMGDAVLGGIGVPFALRVSSINGTTLSNDPGPGGAPGTPPPVGGTPPPGGASGSGVVINNGAAQGGTSVPQIVTLWYRRQASDGTNGLTGYGQGYWFSLDRFTTPCQQTNADSGGFPSAAHYEYGANIRTKNFQIDGNNFSAGENFLTSTYEPLTVGAPNAVAVIDNKLYASQETLGSAATFVQGSLWMTEFAPGQANAPRRIAGPFASESLTSNTVQLSMLAANGQLYFTVAWGATGDNGCVFYYDPTTGAYGKLGTNFLTETPYALAWHSGQLWLGTFHRTGGVPGNVYSITPPKTTTDQEANQATPIAWVLDHAMSSGSGVLTLCSYQGHLYAGSLHASGVAGLIEVRSTLGAWTTSDTIADDGLAHYMMGLIVFGGNLYYADSSVNAAVAIIRKYNGTAWSTAASALGSVIPISWIVENTLMFGGGGDAFGAVLHSSPDGTVWTSRTANLSNNTGLGLSGGGVAVILNY
jgi:hypothetical protein